MRSVGQNIPRLDGHAKVTGQARYVDDITLPGMLFGCTVRSTVSKGRFGAVTRDVDFDWDGITVLTAADILDRGGENVIHLMKDDQPCLAPGVVNHPDEPIALVAADTRERAAEAARHLHIDEIAEPPELDMRTAKGVASQLEIGRGDLDAAFARADRVFEATYRTGAQEQLYIEVQGVIASPREGGGVTVQGSIQCPYYAHRAVKRVVGLPDHEVAVIQTVTGGGFGGKEEYPSLLCSHAALLALATGRPVKMVYDRQEDLRATTKRHPAEVRHRTGVMNDGTLVCVDIDLIMDAGAYVTLTPVVLSRGMLHATGPYRYDALRVTGRAALTNSIPAGAFRGFGAPQVTLAYERHLDHIARQLGLDPLELRRKNSLQVGDLTCTSQVLEESVAGTRVIDAVLKSSNFLARRQAPVNADNPATGARRRRGVGLSYFFHGAGFTGNGEAALKGKVGLELTGPGRVRILTASTDIGQGTQTTFPQIAAETLGISPVDVEMAVPDTSVVPDSGPTVASRTTMVVGKVVFEAAQALKATLEAFAPGVAFVEASALYLAEKGTLRVDSVFETPQGTEWDPETYTGDAYPCYGWAADVAEVEVDLDTGEVFVTDFHTAHDAGRIIHPILAEGQVEGGSLQALGFAHMEQVVWRNGAMANDRMTNYIIPTALDAPEMKTTLVEVPYGYGPYGAKGLGEMPMDGGAPAVLAAIEHAIGRPIPGEAPLTAERLLPLLEGTK